MELQSTLCYNGNMSDILIAGRELQDSIDLTGSIAGTARKIMISGKPEADPAAFETSGIYSCNWNRASAISARSFLLQGETKLQELNEYVLIFDSRFYASKFELDRTENVSAAIDTMVSSYQFMVDELTLRLEQRKDPVTVMFLVKTYPSKSEFLHSGSRNASIVPASNVVSSAQAAFINLAENFATYVNDKSYLSVVLAKCEPSNEAYDDESKLGNWIAQTMDSFAASKSRQSVKQACTWQKAGSKVSSGFSLFK